LKIQQVIEPFAAISTLVEIVDETDCHGNSKQDSKKDVFAPFVAYHANWKERRQEGGHETVGPGYPDGIPVKPLNDAIKTTLSECSFRRPCIHG
jgi:hypothetical protein